MKQVFFNAFTNEWFKLKSIHDTQFYVKII